MKNILDRLINLIKKKKKLTLNKKNNSYISFLFNKGDDFILKKVSEETSEVIIAAKNFRIKNDIKELVYECSDLLFHFVIMLFQFKVNINDILNELIRRENKSGLQEKLDRLN